METVSFEEILLEMGYQLSKEGVAFWRTKPLYRESGNSSSLRISQKNGTFFDFSAQIKGSFAELVQLTKGFKTVAQARKFLEQRGLGAQEETKVKYPKIKTTRTINFSNSLFPNYSFYLKKGIDINVLKAYECGLCMSQKMGNRFVFVIRNEDGDIIGLAGRDLYDNGQRIKWKLLGNKRDWVFPRNVEARAVESKSVYLVESIGDMLALNNAGFWNVIPVFGVVVFPRLVNFLSCLGVNSVYVCFNNDFDSGENVGMKNALVAKEKLSKLIDKDKIKILTFHKNDYGDGEKEEIITFLKNNAQN